MVMVVVMMMVTTTMTMTMLLMMMMTTMRFHDDDAFSCSRSPAHYAPPSVLMAHMGRAKCPLTTSPCRCASLLPPKRGS